MKQLNQTVDEHLDNVLLAQYTFKTEQLQAACICIAEVAAQNDSFWPDEVDFSMLAMEDRNVMGSAYRLLATKFKMIERTMTAKRSTTKNSNGHTIFQYRTLNRPLLRAFLAANKKSGFKDQFEMNLGV